LTQKIGIGIDIVNVNRFRKKKFKKNLNFYRKILFESEIKYCTKFKSPYEHFAAKFAIKESVIKSIPDKISFLDIKTSNSKHGPVVKLVGKLAKKYSFLVSASHEKEYAIAVVTAEIISS
tara:strand:+ start:1014 stop:1373 length:360 start_codon:yes stop_codon:yes gene_type:complete